MLTLERLIAIRTPLHAHLFWRKYKPCFIISFICILSFLLQIYNVFWLIQKKYPNCKDSSKVVSMMKVIELDDNYYFYYFVKYSVIIVPVFTVTLPVILLVVCNVMLLYYIRVSRTELRNLRKSKKLCTNTEWKVTTTVLAIVLTLVVFNLPSVIYFWISYFTVYRSRTLVFFSNFTILVSKSLNFLLYCTVSSNFRRRLCKIFALKAKGQRMKFRRSFETPMMLACKPSTVHNKYYEALDIEGKALWNSPLRENSNEDIAV